MLLGASLRLYHNPLPSEIAVQLDALVAAGCQAVSIVVSHYCSLTPGTPAVCAPPAAFGLPWYLYPDIGQDPNHPFSNTPHPALVELTCRLATARGLQVLLKPHIDSNQASWRGYLSVKDIYQQPARWDVAADWRYAYLWRFLRGYVDIAQRTGAALSLGCELLGITRELGPGYWQDVAHEVRGMGFTGPLTYSANWYDEVEHLDALWADPAITAIGVDWYAPASLWDERAAAIRAQTQRAGKSLWLTEVGCGNWQGALDNPGLDPPPGAVADDAPQIAFWQRVNATFPDVDRFAWEAPVIGQPPAAISDNILRSPAVARLALRGQA